MNKFLLVTIVGLLVFVDFLTFHDIFEPHTFKDWLILVTSIFAFIYFVKVSLKIAK